MVEYGFDVTACSPFLQEFMQTRKERLLEFLEKDPNDSFTHYALALELASEGKTNEAISTFQDLRKMNPGYVGTYYQLAKLLEKTGKTQEAVSIYKEGIMVAGSAGNQHAKSELQSALMNLEMEDL